jgi:hypothetical protein
MEYGQRAALITGSSSLLFILWVQVGEDLLPTGAFRQALQGPAQSCDMFRGLLDERGDDFGVQPPYTGW